jgi:hypothetical protein
MEKGRIPTNKTGDVVITLIYEKNNYCLAVGTDVPGNSMERSVTLNGKSRHGQSASRQTFLLPLNLGGLKIFEKCTP